MLARRDLAPTRQAFLTSSPGSDVHFSPSFDGEQARALFEQGLTQLHALDDLEAERSFRQATVLESSRAVGWWGAALASATHPGRAAAFVREAVRRRQRASARERAFLDAFADYYEVTPASAAEPRAREPVAVVPEPTFVGGDASRSRRLLGALAAIAESDRADVEAAALFVRQVWVESVRGTLGREALAAHRTRAREYLAEILANRPRHPAHVYRLRLALLDDDAGAQRSVGPVGQCAPASASSWTSSGRLLAHLGRHRDALVHYEAAVRVAHAYLERERAMPFAMPAYADAAVGLAECLAHVGRPEAALAWLEYVSDLPRHPRLNRADDPNSIAQRCAVALEHLCQRYRLHGARARWVGEGRVAASSDRVPPADVDTAVRVDALLEAGRAAEAVALLETEAAARPARVATMVRQIAAYSRIGDEQRAAAILDDLRCQGGSAEIEHAFFEPVCTLARRLGLPTDWRRPRDELVEWPRDIWPRPPLDTLGPRYWNPPEPFAWRLPAAEGAPIALRDYRGKPVVVVLYLGFGCLHCVEQLHGLRPLAGAWRDAGVELVAIGTDAIDATRVSLATFEPTERFGFPLLSDRKLRVFREWMAFDDFDGVAMHGTYLIDGEGRLRWQDIGHTPFAETAWLLRESVRLLGQQPK